MGFACSLNGAYYSFEPSRDLSGTEPLRSLLVLSLRTCCRRCGRSYRGPGSPWLWSPPARSGPSSRASGPLPGPSSWPPAGRRRAPAVCPGRTPTETCTFGGSKSVLSHLVAAHPVERATFRDALDTNVPPAGRRGVRRVSGGRVELGLVGRGAGRLPAGDVRLGFAAFAGRQQQVGMVEKPRPRRLRVAVGSVASSGLVLMFQLLHLRLQLRVDPGGVNTATVTLLGYFFFLLFFNFFFFLN